MGCKKTKRLIHLHLVNKSGSRVATTLQCALKKCDARRDSSMVTIELLGWKVTSRACSLCRIYVTDFFIFWDDYIICLNMRTRIL